MEIRKRKGNLIELVLLIVPEKPDLKVLGVRTQAWNLKTGSRPYFFAGRKKVSGLNIVYHSEDTPLGAVAYPGEISFRG